MPLATGKENIGSSSAATMTKRPGGVGPRSGNKSPASRPGCSISSPGLGRVTSMSTTKRSRSITASSSTPTAQRVGLSVRGSKTASKSNNVAPRVVSTPPVGGATVRSPASRNKDGGGVLPNAMQEGLGQRSAKKVLLSTPVMEPSRRMSSKRKGVRKTESGGIRRGALDAKQRAVTRANQGNKGKDKAKLSGVARESWKQKSPLEGDPSEVFNLDADPEDDVDGHGSEEVHHGLLRSVTSNGSRVPGRGSLPNTGSQDSKKGTASKKQCVIEDFGGRRAASTKKRKGNDGAVATAAKYSSKQGDGPRRSLAVLSAADAPLATSPIKHDSSTPGSESSRGWARLRELFGDSDEEDERKRRNASLWRLSDDEDSSLDDLETELRSRTCSRRKSWDLNGGGDGTSGANDGNGGRSRAGYDRRRSTGGLSNGGAKAEKKSMKGWDALLSGRRGGTTDDRENRVGGDDGDRSMSTYSGARAASTSESGVSAATGGRCDWMEMSKTDQGKLEALAAHYREVDSFPLMVSSQRNVSRRM